MEALRYYEKHLDAVVFPLGEDDESLVQYDHLERLQRIIPNFEHQMKELETE